MNYLHCFENRFDHLPGCAPHIKDNCKTFLPYIIAEIENIRIKHLDFFIIHATLWVALNNVTKCGNHWWAGLSNLLHGIISFPEDPDATSYNKLQVKMNSKCLGNLAIIYETIYETMMSQCQNAMQPFSECHRPW